MELFDTHCHIQSVGQVKRGEAMTRSVWAKAGDTSSDDLLERAREADVTLLNCVGCDIDDSRLAVEFVGDKEQCWATVGIHPHEAHRYIHDLVGTRAALADLTASPKVVAIGECGLDYFHGDSTRDDQLALLQLQIELAIEHDLALVFHVRDAFNDFWPVFERYVAPGRSIRGVLHSFTDSQANLDRAAGHGLLIGVNGIATFTKQPKQQELYRSVPSDQLILETDAPFLTPHPYRGKICEPYHIRVTAEFLAGQRNEPVAQLAAATTRNARRLFGI